MSAKIGSAELSLLLLVLCAVVVPIAAFAFARSGKGLKELGKGTFAIDLEKPGQPEPINPELNKAEHEAEVRQMVEASAFRRRARGEPDIDVQSEIDRILGVGPWAEVVSSEVGGEDGASDEDAAAGLEGGVTGIRAEIRQLVIANNERRVRRGEEPLDVDSEVERRLQEWT
ncbi:MAG: hypothetical protein ACSLFI_09370 [Solirubrobacterales bacterium]